MSSQPPGMRQLPDSMQSQLSVSVLTGGANTIVSRIMPVHLETDTANKYYYFLDGDMKPDDHSDQASNFPSSTSIPESESPSIEDHLFRLNGQKPEFNVDGNSGVSQNGAKVTAMRKFYDFSLKRLCYLPIQNPEAYLLSLIENDYQSILENTESMSDKEKLEVIVNSKLGDPSLTNSNSIHLILCGLWNNCDVSEFESNVANLLRLKLEE